VSETEIDRVVLALHEGRLAVLPTDTVYGLACSASREDAARDLYRLKGRAAIQPTAVVFATVELLFDDLPGLGETPAAAVRELLPGPYTLVVPNPARRFAWLSAGRPDAIGVRVPALPAPTAAIVTRAGAVAATSANLPGGPDPRRLEDVPAQILEGAAAAIDGGALPGTPSTVIDLTGAEPAVLRAGAGDPDEVLRRLA
jgi:L-threonylcarbamoyladenylate synthase